MAKNNDFERRLDKMQSIRENFIDKLSLDPDEDADFKMPVDEKEMQLLAQLMRDVDNSEIKRRKLAIDADDADTNRLVAEMTIEATRNAGNQNPFRRGSDGSPIPVTNTEKLGEYEFTDGEKLQGTHIETVAEFEDRAGKI